MSILTYTWFRGLCQLRLHSLQLGAYFHPKIALSQIPVKGQFDPAFQLKWSRALICTCTFIFSFFFLRFSSIPQVILHPISSWKSGSEVNGTGLVSTVVLSSRVATACEQKRKRDECLLGTHIIFFLKKKSCINNLIWIQAQPVSWTVSGLCSSDLLRDEREEWNFGL